MKMKRNGIIRYAGLKRKQNTTLTVQYVTERIQKQQNLKKQHNVPTQCSGNAADRKVNNNNKKQTAKKVERKA
jgi:hypothetical protein